MPVFPSRNGSKQGSQRESRVSLSPKSLVEYRGKNDREGRGKARRFPSGAARSDGFLCERRRNVELVRLGCASTDAACTDLRTGGHVPVPLTSYILPQGGIIVICGPELTDPGQLSLDEMIPPRFPDGDSPE